MTLVILFARFIFFTNSAFFNRSTGDKATEGTFFEVLAKVRDEKQNRSPRRPVLVVGKHSKRLTTNKQRLSTSKDVVVVHPKQADHVGHHEASCQVGSGFVGPPKNLIEHTVSLVLLAGCNESYWKGRRRGSFRRDAGQDQLPQIKT